MTTVISTNKMEWQDHPAEAGVKSKFLAQFPDQKLRFRLNRIGEEGVAEHSHSNGHIVFVLSGRGKMWVEDAGDVELTSGTFLIVPPNVKHSISDVVEPVELLSISTFV